MNRPIAPLFNISKRPRQALVSDPCDSQVSTPNIKPTPGPSSNAGNQHGSHFGSQNKLNNNHMALLPPKPSLPQYRTQRPQSGGQSRAPVPHQPGPGGDGLNSAKYDNFGRGKKSQNQSGLKNGVVDVGHRNLGHQTQNFNRGTTGYGQIGMTSQKSNINQRPTVPSHTCSNSNARAGYLHQETSLSSNNQSGWGSSNWTQQNRVPSRTVCSGPNPGKSTSWKGVAPPQNQKGFSALTYNSKQTQPCSTFGSQPQPSTSHSSKSVIVKPTANKSITDKSLRVFTASIQSVAHWGSSVHSIPAMFELHGIIDSAVTTNPISQGKEFLLKDETGVLPCVFFEIDRSIGRLTRGQWYRCVGSYDRKLEKLKCVSVRPSIPAERSLAKLALKASDLAMKSLIRQLREA